ncbi:MAG: DUF2057 domain-containing protein [Shewanella sp.]
MKSHIFIIAILTLLGSSSALAANLNIPMSFEFLAIDGKKVDNSLFSHKADLELSQGTHKIAIRYHDLVPDDFSDGDSFVKSSPFIITLAVDGDHKYTLKSADGDIVKRPKSFAKSPQVLITRSDQGAVSYEVTQTDFIESSFMTSLFGGGNNQNIEAITVAATSSAGISTSTSATTTPVGIPATVNTMPFVPANVNETNKDQHAQQMLQYWWLQADDKTRKEFMSWAIQQL